MRTLVEGFPHGWQIEIVKRCNVKPVYWIANDLGNANLLPEGVIFHDCLDAIQNVPPPTFKDYKINYLDDKFFREHTDFIDIVMRMYYLRQNIYPKKLYVTYSNVRRFFYKQVAYWNYILDTMKIELVLIEAMPHLPYHYINYYLAKVKGLKIIFLHRIGEPTRFFVCESMNNLTPMETSSFFNEVENICPINEPPLYNIRKKRSWKRALSTVALQFKDIVKNNKFNDVVVRLQNRFKYELSELCHKIKRLFYIKEYKRYALKEIPNSDFIYFPLHEQPEDTSFPVGKNFEDQLYAIDYLSELLPDDVTILIKEHPNQRIDGGGRYLKYYKDLGSIRKAKLISTNISTFELIKHCKAVATLTGQAGWEALTNGKPVITFAHPWYRDCPYVFHIDEIKSNPSILNLELDVDQDQINKFHAQFMNSTYEGYINTICMPSSRLSLEENIEAVALAINKKLESYSAS